MSCASYLSWLAAHRYAGMMATFLCVGGPLDGETLEFDGDPLFELNGSFYVTDGVTTVDGEELNLYRWVTPDLPQI